MLPVTSRDEIGDLTESFNDMARNLREKEKIKRAFSSYVARQVVDEILKHPDDITFSGERRDVTVIFCDMRGFTSLTEKLPPEEVVLALNAFYSLMIELTIKNNGTINKFLGDAVMAIFGAPTAYPDHCLRAVTRSISPRGWNPTPSPGRFWLASPLSNRSLIRWMAGAWERFMLRAGKKRSSCLKS